MRGLFKKVVFINAFTGMLLQLANILATFILPKLLLSYFGSEVNGLVDSICNFLLYISLIEAGVANVVMASLYKPIRNRDMLRISKICNTCDHFYRKITAIFVAYTFILAIVYPLLNKTEFSFGYIFSLVIILSLSYFIQFSFSNTVRTLLKADKKVYIVNIAQIAIIIFGLILSVVSLLIYPDIHILKMVSGILYIIQPIVFNHYVKKYFKIDKKAGIDNNLLKNRWDALSISVASFIHNMTDIALLTFFTDLKTVSVYSIYYLVIRGIEAIMIAISNGIIPSLGNLYASDDLANLDKKFNIYEFIYTILVFIVSIIALLLITPFVSVYTSGIYDADYYQPLFGYLVVIAEMFFLLKTPHLNLAYGSNKFKDMKKACYIEAIINIVISLSLVVKLGLVGVAVGTLVAMAYRAFFQFWLVRKTIPFRNLKKYLSKLVIFTIGSIVIILLCLPITSIYINSWWLLILVGAAYCLISCAVFFVICLVCCKDDMADIRKYLKRR